MSAAPRPAVLLGTQLVFNVGFYAVVPFLAVVLRDDYLLGGAAVGLVLGVRTFAQQGLFLLGGILTDLLGARRLILLGCAVRVAGFAALALAPGLGVLVLGAVLTGLGGALFSPAVETLVARAEAARPPGPATRSSLFALLAVVGETGAVLGPLLGAALFGWGFTTVALSGAALFACVGVALVRLIPAGTDAPSHASARARADDLRSGLSLRHRRFVAFALLHAVNLLAWNQLYLGLPAELQRVGAGPVALGVLLAVVSAVTITLQIPVARLARRLGPRVALPAGYCLIAAGFAVLAVAAPMAPPAWSTAPALGAAVLLTLGHLTVGPTALDLVPRFADGRPLGSYYGLLATCGGVVVLLLSVPLGAWYVAASTPGPGASLPWAVLTVLPLCSALGMAALLRRMPTRTAVPA
ncbi:MFS transporter [Nocardioides alkalitolerans]|uniref:MFS transporter n=1 Tax=Nocardioides alkalitolerans TaxID=281714 RepID=UPI0003FDEFB6|nr:MFS transporter [Nocardioides alkalitolerans]